MIHAELIIAEDREAALSVAAEERVERRLYEVQLIKQIDASLAAEIEAAERQIAEALARQRAAEEARRRAEEEARRRAEEEARRQAEREAQQAQTEPVTPDGEDFTLVWVQGYQVNSQIADDVDGLVTALEAEGFDMGGWGYRTIRSRSTCDDPTAARRSGRSGRSRRTSAGPRRPDRGAATTRRAWPSTSPSPGRLIRSRDSAVFQALQRLAPQFGLRNLPSEPWHWSVDGR